MSQKLPNLQLQSLMVAALYFLHSLNWTYLPTGKEALAPPRSRSVALTRVPSNFLLSPGNSLASRPALVRALETPACRQHVRTLRSPHAHQAISLTLMMSPVTPASRRGKQTEKSHQHQQILGFWGPRYRLPTKGRGPGTQAWEPELFAALRSAACRQGRVKS